MDKEGKIREDWLINNGNIFNLSKIESLSVFTIQVEILNQIKGEKFPSIKDFLTFNIDIMKEIHLTDNLTIASIFKKELGFDLINIDNQKVQINLIFGYLKMWLFKKYLDDNNNLLLTVNTYKKLYEKIKNDFIENNLDTDENDFIRIELEKCHEVIIELNKPIYNKINVLGDVLDTPDDFKKNLLNSLDKRIKYLKSINSDLDKPTNIKNQNSSTLIASVNMVSRTITIPDLIGKTLSTNKELMNEFIVFDKLLYQDESANDYIKLKDSAKKLINIVPDNYKLELIKTLEDYTTVHKLQKQNEFKYDKGNNIEDKPIQRGTHTEQSRFVKVDKEKIDLKIDTLIEFLNWLNKLPQIAEEDVLSRPQASSYKNKESFTYNDNRQYNHSQIIEKNEGKIEQNQNNRAVNDDNNKKSIWEKIKFILDFSNALSQFIYIILGIIIFFGYNFLYKQNTSSNINSIIDSLFVKPSDKSVLDDTLILPYLDNVTILDKGLFLRYNYNDFDIGGVNIDSISINARTKKGDVATIAKGKDNIQIHSIYNFPFVEIEYKGVYYSIEVCGEYMNYYCRLNRIETPTMKLKKYSTIK